MKYSIIITYRDRQDHLTKLLPRLREKFEGTEYEIIISEQMGNGKFRKNTLNNIAAKQSSGEILIFHDVDHYPMDNVSYDIVDGKPTYPIRNVIFLGPDDKPLNRFDIPLGYQNFHKDVGEHSGGVFILSRDHYENMKGLNSMYIGWGKEDDDTRDRARHALNTDWHRNLEGSFYAFHHQDNKPGNEDEDFKNNHELLSEVIANSTTDFRPADLMEKAERVATFDGDDVIWIRVEL